MALAALIAAYQEDETGSLRALLPLAGRSLLDYQVRCAAAAGASSIVVHVERIPAALNQVIESLQRDGFNVITASDATDAAARLEPGALVLVVADGLVPPPEMLAALAEEEEPTIVTVPDDEGHERFERIDALSRWAGLALVDLPTLGATAAMLGDWDLQSTLLRRALQSGARTVPVAPGSAEPLLAENPSDLAGLERRLIVASRESRSDWASRFVLPLVEEFATEKLLETRIRPTGLLLLALLLCGGAALAFTQGWLATGLALMVATTPLGLIARRLGTLRLRPMPARSLYRRLLWPASGIALLALGWWQAGHGGGWGALFSSVTAVAFAEAARIERGKLDVPGGIWLFSRRNAILAAIPFAALGAWTSLIVALALYAAGSFFLVQHLNHQVERS